MSLLIDCSSIFHFFELPDESIRDIDFPEIGHVRGALVVVLSDVVRLDGARINAERSAGVVNFLLEDSWRGIDVDGRILDPILSSKICFRGSPVSFFLLH